jgi:hypothetical protein
MLGLFLTEAYLVIAGYLGYRNRTWATAWLPVYPIGRVLFVSASLIDGLIIGLYIAGIGALAATIGHALRPTTAPSPRSAS